MERQHAVKPSDLLMARKLWEALDWSPVDNLKSVTRAYLTFREAALESVEGLEALAAALMEVFDLTGVPPKPSDFKAELEVIGAAPESESSAELRWVKLCLSEGH